MTNRRERRAQAKEKSDPINYSHPSREAPKHKTLLDLASERAAALNGSPTTTTTTASNNSKPSITTTQINPDGTLSPVPSSPSSSSDPGTESQNQTFETLQTPLWLDTALYTTTLTLLHFTLTLLVQHQYASAPPSLTLSSLLQLFYTATLRPLIPLLLAVLIYTLHPHSNHWALQTVFGVVSVVVGCWVVRVSNEEAYLAVMRKVPVLGVVWVWVVMELRWEVALLGLVGVGGWSAWWGYGVT